MSGECNINGVIEMNDVCDKLSKRGRNEREQLQCWWGQLTLYETNSYIHKRMPNVINHETSIELTII